MNISEWLERNDRSAAWIGKQIGLGPSQSAAVVAGRAVPSLAQRMAIELLTEGAVGRDQWDAA